MESVFSLGEQVNSLVKRFVWKGWRYEEIMHSALSKLLYLWDLEEQRGGVRGLKSSYEGKRASIMGRDEPSRNHILKK